MRTDRARCVAFALPLALAACASPAVPLVPGLIARVRIDAEVPAEPTAADGADVAPPPPRFEERTLAPAHDGIVPPMVRDPTGAFCGWLDLRYGASDGVDPALQSLDVIAPASVLGESGAPSRDLPVVVWVHGGGWSRGGKRGGLEQRSEAFCAAGCLFVSVGYRLAPQWQHPAQVRDVAAAVAWLRRHARAFGGDPQQLFVMGHSAGAHLAALLAVDERWLGEHDEPLSALRGAILVDGASYDLVARAGDREQAGELLESVFGADRGAWVDASPLTHVAAGKGTPPCLLLVAGRNPDSPEDARLLAERLQAAGVRADPLTFPNKTHVGIARDLGRATDAPTRACLRFIGEVTGRRPAAPRRDPRSPDLGAPR